METKRKQVSLEFRHLSWTIGYQSSLSIKTSYWFTKRYSSPYLPVAFSYGRKHLDIYSIQSYRGSQMKSVNTEEKTTPETIQIQIDLI